ncbi:MAG: hypothetical protein Q8O25_11360, partial [Sulfurisoma sp.]|nr:hypothetical protein [Sulfurisoma sp.]
RPWITLPPCQSDMIVNTQATICSPRNPTSTTVHVRPKQVFTISEMRIGAVGGFIADGAGGGQTATRPAKNKSRRWRDGDSRRDEAVTRFYRVTAWFRLRCGRRACKPQAGERSFRWPVQWRSDGGAGGAAVTGGTKPVRGFMRSGVVQYVMR